MGSVLRTAPLAKEPVGGLRAATASVAKPTAKPLAKKRWWWRHPRITVVAVVVVLGLAGAATWAYTHRAKKVTVASRVVRPVVKPVPQPAYSLLTGLPVASEAAVQQPVIGVMIENLYPNARPQSGLGQAGVVYEALAEGGITRFLAIFQEPLPAVIGPVRSLRPYYLDWGLEYGIPVAHAGGSQPALAEVPTSGLKDINALTYDGSYFYRSSDRAAPHNLYTTSKLLTTLDTKLGYAVAPMFQTLPRKADKAQSPATHPKITIAFSGGQYAVEYDFDPTTDSYKRSMGGTPHIDRNTNQQITVKNVVVEFVPTTYSTQPDGKPETDMDLIGSGQAWVFNNGGLTTATWNKSSDSAATSLLDSSGQPISFNRGNTWYEVVPVGNTVTY